MAAVRHLEFCYSGPPTRATKSTITPSKFGVEDIAPEILRFYNFAGLAGKCHSPIWGFWESELIKIVGRHPNPQKAHRWVTEKSNLLQ